MRKLPFLSALVFDIIHSLNETIDNNVNIRKIQCLFAGVTQPENVTRSLDIDKMNEFRDELQNKTVITEDDGEFFHLFFHEETPVLIIAFKVPVLVKTLINKLKH